MAPHKKARGKASGRQMKSRRQIVCNDGNDSDSGSSKEHQPSEVVGIDSSDSDEDRPTTSKVIAKADTESEDSDSDASGENEYVVESIRNKKTTKTGIEYYIKWKGYPHSDNTWEPEANVNCPQLIKKFEEELIAKLNGKAKGGSRVQPTKAQNRSTSDSGDESESTSKKGPAKYELKIKMFKKSSSKNIDGKHDRSLDQKREVNSGKGRNGRESNAVSESREFKQLKSRSDASETFAGKSSRRNEKEGRRPTRTSNEESDSELEILDDEKDSLPQDPDDVDTDDGKSLNAKSGGKAKGGSRVLPTKAKNGPTSDESDAKSGGKAKGGLRVQLSKAKNGQTSDSGDESDATTDGKAKGGSRVQSTKAENGQTSDSGDESESTTKKRPAKYELKIKMFKKNSSKSIDGKHDRSLDQKREVNSGKGRNGKESNAVSESREFKQLKSRSDASETLAGKSSSRNGKGSRRRTRTSNEELEILDDENDSLPQDPDDVDTDDGKSLNAKSGGKAKGGSRVLPTKAKNGPPSDESDAKSGGRAKGGLRVQPSKAKNGQTSDSGDESDATTDGKAKGGSRVQPSKAKNEPASDSGDESDAKSDGNAKGDSRVQPSKAKKRPTSDSGDESESASKKRPVKGSKGDKEMIIDDPADGADLSKDSEKSTTPRNEENENNSETPVANGFGPGLHEEEVIAVAMRNNNLMLLIKWKDLNKADWVASEEANLKIPQLVIAYYEKRITWGRKRKTQ